MQDSDKYELKRYRFAVHCYLDALWLISGKRYNARCSWYNWLANQMGKSSKDTHVSKFSLNDCKLALSLLKPKYKELTGRNNIPKSLIKKMKNVKMIDESVIERLYNKER